MLEKFLEFAEEHPKVMLSYAFVFLAAIGIGIENGSFGMFMSAVGTGIKLT